MVFNIYLDNAKNQIKVFLRKVVKTTQKKRKDQEMHRSLQELKKLVLQDLGKDPAIYGSLSKSDIVEMVLNYVQNGMNSEIQNDCFNHVCCCCSGVYE